MKTKKPTIKQGTITITNNPGYEHCDTKIKAYILGLLALHRTPDAIGWTITHIPTGLRVCTSTRPNFNNARKFLRDLQTPDWSLVPYKPKATDPIIKRLGDYVKTKKAKQPYGAWF